MCTYPRARPDSVCESQSASQDLTAKMNSGSKAKSPYFHRIPWVISMIYVLNGRESKKSDSQQERDTYSGIVSTISHALSLRVSGQRFPKCLISSHYAGSTLTYSVKRVGLGVLFFECEKGTSDTAHDVSDEYRHWRFARHTRNGTTVRN